MNTAELTALHTETIAAVNLSRTLTNISRRAAALFSEAGYRMEEAWKGLYHVYGPQGQHYMVTCCPMVGYHCDCPAFSEYSTCKHLEAVDIALRDETQAAEYDALYTDADNGAYAEF